MTDPIHKEYAKLRRQPFLMPLGLPVALGMVLLAAVAWAVLSASTTTVYVVRHAEPAAGTSGSLSLAGQLRAARLQVIFGSAPPGLVIDGVVVSEDRVTQDTVRPLANALAVPVIVMPARDPAAIARRALAEFRGGRVLVVDDAAGVAAIVEELTGEAVAPVSDTEFGVVYVIARPRYSPASVGVLRLP
jgi:putative cell wall-binding protein